MIFTLEVVFTGLCLFCLPTGEEDQKKRNCKLGTDSKALVFLAKAPDSCSGGDLHFPRICFDPNEAVVMAGEEMLKDYGDGQLCAELKDADLSFKNFPPSSRLTYEGVRRVKQEKPRLLFNDANAIGWLPTLNEIDYDAGPLKDSVYSTFGAENPVLARIRLGPGQLRVEKLFRYSDDRKHIVWKPNGEDGSLKKALPDQVVWKVNKVRKFVDLLFKQGEDKESHLVLRPKKKRFVLLVRNSPKRAAEKKTRIPHVKCFYNLVNPSGNDRGDGEMANYPIFATDGIVPFVDNSYCPPIAMSIPQ